MPFVNSIILADDDPDDVEIFTEAVNNDIQLEVVRDGRQLMALLEHIQPDLLFLDLEMPYKNGLECLVEIRNNEGLKDLPVVVFSSTTRQVNIQTAYDMGGHLFLIKSPIYQELVAGIQTIFQLDWSDPVAIKEQYRINIRYAAFG